MQAKWMLPTVAVCCLFAPMLHAQSDPKAAKILELTNQDRQEHGLQPLKWNDALADAASKHAQLMAESKDLSHQYPGEDDVSARAAQSGAHFQAIAENIAVGYSPEAIEKEWMKSVPHRTNILDPQMNTIGIAVAEHKGYLYAVEDFANASEQVAPDAIEHKIGDLVRAQGVDTSGPSEEAKQACRMRDGMPQGSTAKGVIRFQTPDLTQLPPQVADRLRSGGFTKAAVGACPSQATGNFTTYRVAILLY
jgi:hypothetical protein